MSMFEFKSNGGHIRIDSNVINGNVTATVILDGDFHVEFQADGAVTVNDIEFNDFDLIDNKVMELASALLPHGGAIFRDGSITN